MSANIQKKKGGPDRHPVAPWMFLAPYLLYAAVFFVYPLLYAGWLAFHQTDGPHTAIFVGLDNFKFIFTDSMFWKAMSNTTIYAIASICIQLPISLGLAMLLNNSNSRMKGAFRLMIFSPNLVGQIFVGVMFAVIFTPHYGLFNKGLDALIGWGLEKQWLADPNLLLPALIIISLWMYVGYNMIYFLAGLQNIEYSVYEAANIDGASGWKTFWHITVPLLRPVIVMTGIMSINGTLQLFDESVNLTNGGPANATITMSHYIYNNALGQGVANFGYASALSFIVFIMVAILAFINLKVGDTRD